MQVLLYLYQELGDEKYKKAADILAKQIATQPRTKQGGFWHKDRYPDQMWLDGLYMLEPFYAEYSNIVGEDHWNDIFKQFELMEKGALDAKTGAKLWEANVSFFKNQMVTSTPVLYKDKVFAPVSQYELASAMADAYVCCKARGGAVLPGHQTSPALLRNACRVKAARAASPGVSMTKVAGRVMAAFGVDDDPHPEEPRSGVSKDGLNRPTHPSRLANARTSG